MLFLTFSLTSSLTTLLLAHSLPATLAYLLFFKHSKCASTVGRRPVHLPGMIFHQLSTWLITLLYSVLYSNFTPSERFFLTPLSKIAPLSYFIPLSCFITSVHYIGNIFIFISLVHFLYHNAKLQEIGDLFCSLMYP